MFPFIYKNGKQQIGAKMEKNANYKTFDMRKLKSPDPGRRLVGIDDEIVEKRISRREPGPKIISGFRAKFWPQNAFQKTIHWSRFKAFSRRAWAGPSLPTSWPQAPSAGPASSHLAPACGRPSLMTSLRHHLSRSPSHSKNPIRIRDAIKDIIKWKD